MVSAFLQFNSQVLTQISVFSHLLLKEEPFEGNKVRVHVCLSMCTSQGPLVSCLLGRHVSALPFQVKHFYSVLCECHHDTYGKRYMTSPFTSCYSVHLNSNITLCNSIMYLYVCVCVYYVYLHICVYVCVGVCECAYVPITE